MEGKKWTKAEYDQLAEEWGMYSIPTIAQRLGRSPAAVKIKAQKLGLGASLESSDFISFNILLKTLGLSGGGYAYKLKLFTEAGLKIHLQRVQNNTFRMVDLDEFWEFAEKNQHLIDFSRLEENALGLEPEWVKAKRAEDYKRASAAKTHKQKWTEAEDKELLRLLRTYRYTYPEIAARLHRLEGAVTRRISELGYKERPLKADNQTRWTDEELQTLCDMIKSGSNYESMSLTFEKSVKAIRGKVFTVYLTENLDKVRELIGTGKWGDNRPERKLSQRLCMTAEEKKETKAVMSKLCGVLAYKLRKHFDDQDNWQRNLCQHWNEVKGCEVGGSNCDDCSDFLRIRPQYCVRCGATFFERVENKRCERCRTARKKQAARKFFRNAQKN